jgi:zinc protease
VAAFCPLLEGRVGCALVIALALFSAAPARAAETAVTQFTLQNGMQVVVIPDHRAPVVTQMIWYKVGAVDDPPGHSGLAHFFEHMMFRGTRLEPGDSYSRTLARNGGDDNAFTTEDYTAFYEQLARDRLKIAMGLEADRMAHLDLSDAAVRTERDVVLEERRMRIDNNPQSLAGEQVSAALYLSHPYGRPVIGWPEEVHRLGRAEAQAFYDRHYAPNNAILVIAGDVTAAEVKADATATLGLVPARTLEPRVTYAEPERLGETRLNIARPDAAVQNFSRTWRVPSYVQDKPGQAEALEVLAGLMGSDSTGVLYRKLVVEQTLATDTGATYDGNARNSGEFSVYAVPRPGVTLPAIGHAALRRRSDARQDAVDCRRSLSPRQPALDGDGLWPGAGRRAQRRRYPGLAAPHPGGDGAGRAQCGGELFDPPRGRDALPDAGTCMRNVALAILFALCAVAPAAASAPRVLDIGPNEQVWFEEDHTVPMVAVSISLPAGSVYDPANKPGLAAFTAYLLNEGAGNLRSEAYQAELANRAIQFSMSPDRDTLILSLNTLSAQAKDAFRLLGLALQKPRFDADAVARVRSQMLQSLQQDAADPVAVAADRFYQVYFGNHPYAHAIEGDAVSLNAITAADLRSFARGHWVRGGVRIAVAGDIDAATLTALLKSVFDPLPATQPPPPPPVLHAGTPGQTTVVAMAVPQPTAIFGLPGMVRSDPAYLAGYVANHIVGGGGFSSRLTNEVREKRGLTYGISTGFADFQGGGVVFGQVATRQDSMATSLGVVRDVLADYAAHGPTAQELADAKTYLTGSYPLAFASNTGIVSQLNAFQRAGLPIGYVARRNGLINALTLAQVKQAAARLFDPRKMTVVIGGSILVAAAHKPVKPAKSL